MVQVTVAPVGWATEPCNVGLLTVKSSSHCPADVAALADVELLGPSPQAISAAIEANESDKMLLRNMSILLFVSLDAGVLWEPVLRNSRTRPPARRLDCVVERHCRRGPKRASAFSISSNYTGAARGNMSPSPGNY